MIQCPDAHLFCTECVTSFASTKLGEHNPAILCMDQSGCTLPFPDSELRRILSAKLWDLYERVRQSKEVDAAGLEGLEECPFCEYKVLIECEFEQEKLLRCRNEECGKISCRKCKKEVSRVSRFLGRGLSCGMADLGLRDFCGAVGSFAEELRRQVSCYKMAVKF